MDKSFKIQMDIKNNAEDLQNYVSGLNNWEKEMKKKELELSKESPTHGDLPPPRNKIKRNKSDSEKTSSKSKTKRIAAYDYSAWDKYDVDKACAELDEDQKEIQNNVINENNKCEKKDTSSEDDENDDEKLSLIDKAFYEKELGNQFVKKEQWSSAIKCYTNAINLESNNPIYYANRSLCFLKLKNFRSAEVDATTAIQLDKNYVKAYQRRGFARLELGQLAEAKSDFEEVLKVEPKSSLMRLEVNKINEKLNKTLKSSNSKIIFNHKNIFKEEKKEVPKKSVNTSKNNSLDKVVGIKASDGSVKNPIESSAKLKNQTESAKTEGQLQTCRNGNKKLDGTKNRGDGDKEVSPDLGKEEPSVFKELQEHCRIVHPIQIPPHKRSKKPLTRISIVEVDDEENPAISVDSASLKSDKDLKIKTETIINKEKEYDLLEEQKVSLEMPVTSVQFQNTWKYIKRKPINAFTYLKKTSMKLSNIFENSLESDLFSDLITFLANNLEENQLDVVYSCLLGLSNVKRFSSMVLFMSKEDKICVKKCISELESVRSKSKNEIDELLRLYEL